MFYMLGTDAILYEIDVRNAEKGTRNNLFSHNYKLRPAVFGSVVF